jgi:hypothetical protein
VARLFGQLDPDLSRDAPRRGSRAAEDVRAEVQPVRATRFRANTATEAFRRLQHRDVKVSEIPRCCEAADACADDHHIPKTVGVVQLSHSKPPRRIEGGGWIEGKHATFLKHHAVGLG